MVALRESGEIDVIFAWTSSNQNKWNDVVAGTEITRLLQYVVGEHQSGARRQNRKLHITGGAARVTDRVTMLLWKDVLSMFLGALNPPRDVAIVHIPLERLSPCLPGSRWKGVETFQLRPDVL